MRDFWLSCGHHLLDRDDSGWLLVSDEFLKAYLARPELAPPADAAPAEIAGIGDRDARENWRVMLSFRDRLLRQRTIEATYVDLVRHGVGDTPPMFINQLVHVILRNLLDRCEDPFVLRAAELFFRPQRLGLHGGSLIAADEETIAGTHPQPVSPLVAMLGLPMAG